LDDAFHVVEVGGALAVAPELAERAVHDDGRAAMLVDLVTLPVVRAADLEQRSVARAVRAVVDDCLEESRQQRQAHRRDVLVDGVGDGDGRLARHDPVVLRVDERVGHDLGEAAADEDVAQRHLQHFDRLFTGDVREEPIEVLEMSLRDVLVGCGLSEVVTYSFIHPEHNRIVSREPAIAITNAINENISSMRLSLLPGLLETIVYNRSYGTRDGALFEIGRTYHRQGDKVHEHRRAAIVMYGSLGEFWGDSKRAADFYDVKGIVEQLAAKVHVPLTFTTTDDEHLRIGKRATA